MIFNLIKHAKQLLFDDSTANTGSNNVQGAVDKISSDINSISEDINYYTSGGSVYHSLEFANGATIKKYTTAENMGVIEVVRAHDDILGSMVKEALAIQCTEPASNVSALVLKCGAVCILTGVIKVGSAGIPVGNEILRVPVRPFRTVSGVGMDISNKGVINLSINKDDEFLFSPNYSVPANSYLAFNITFIASD